MIHVDFRKLVDQASKGDIALLRLTQKIMVNLENLPTLSFENVLEGTTGVYYGFGRHFGPENQGYWSSYMKYARINTTDYRCNIKEPLTDLVFLCWTHIGNTIAAPGDSGSPVLFGDPIEDPFYKSTLGAVMVSKVNRTFPNGKIIEINRGARIFHYYHWINHVIYFDDTPRKPVKKVVYCCIQEIPEIYCIKLTTKYKAFTEIERFPIKDTLQKTLNGTSCENNKF